jgi:ATP-dependent DNA helicase RecQ
MEQTQEEDYLSAAVKRFFGLNYLYPYQRLVVSNILEAIAGNKDENGDCAGSQIVILPTGAGKSLCFQLPAMLVEGATLVIYPILSLMADQERRLNELAEKTGQDFMRPVVIRGGQSADERNEIFRRVQSGQSRFIIANPEVLLTEKLLETLPSLGIVHMVIDESHCVSEWGESFRPSYLRIGEIVKAIGGEEKPPVVTAFTATASAPVLEKISRYVFGGDVKRIVGNPDRSNIEYSAKGALLKDLAVRDLLMKNELPAIVFCSSREGCEKLSRYLRYWFGNAVRFYHAGMTKEERKMIEKWFFDVKELVLVATCAFGMGIDRADIRTVIHRDAPPSPEAYLQESGRAGRDGQKSKAFIVWGEEDELALMRADGGENRRRVQKLLDYARDAVNCRREALMGFMDYSPPGPYPEKPEDGCCDVCEGKASPRYREERSLLEFFRRNARCFTVKEAARILAASKEVDWSEDEAKYAVNTLLRQGKLKELKRPWKGKLIPAPGQGRRRR